MLHRVLSRAAFIFFLSISAIGQRTSGSERAPGLSELAHAISLQVVVPNYVKGSGVWLSEGYVATCWHVVKDANQPGQIVVKAEDFHFGFKKGDIVHVSYPGLATVVAHDEVEDVAILKIDSDFETQLTAHFAAPEIRDTLPESGHHVLLAGYPLQGIYFLSQFGNVAGQGIEGEDYRPPLAQKSVRLFVSVISNPGNSGGPVLNESGQLIGILRGNLPSPMSDDNRPLLYYRPKRDNSGSIILDQDGHDQPEIREMDQNSGISVIVPVHYVLQMLEEARSHPRQPAACKPKADLYGEAIAVARDLEQLVTSRSHPPDPRRVTEQMSQVEIGQIAEDNFERSVAYENETIDSYQQQFALRVLTLRNDLAACGIHDHRVDMGYGDRGLVNSVIMRELAQHILALAEKLR